MEKLASPPDFYIMLATDERIIKTNTMGWVKTEGIVNRNAKYEFEISTPNFMFGFKIHDWGIRIMLGKWQYCHRKNRGK